MATTATPDRDAMPTNAAGAPKRLVVELNRRTNADLTWLVDEEELNKTTIVNRAVQVYRMLIEAQRNGGGVVIDNPATGAQERVHFV